MTSPLSSLGKIRKMPLQLQTSGKRAVPFKGSIQNEDEAVMMNEILGPGAQIPVSEPSCSDGTAAKTGAAPTDMELMACMLQKIASLEQQVKSQGQAIQLRDKKIRELEEKINILQKGKEESSESSRTKELEALCLKLQRQIWEMECFLNDYGLIWVGEGLDSAETLESPKEEESQPSRACWKPGDTLLSGTPINFDVIFQNLKDLNALAGEGTSQIEHTAVGARLRELDAIPLTFYQNGIVMFNGPFRSYEEPSTQRCLRDIMDGYFPSELQRRYPDGVPFLVTDKRDVFFKERQILERFPGLGQATGRSKPSRTKETSEVLGPKQTMEQFLSKLPKSLIRGGQVIDVRGEIRKTLKGLGGARSHEVVLVETPSLSEMKKRWEGHRKEELADPKVSTLRIRSENGEKTYVIKMAFTETIGDLRRYLAQNRGEETEPYEVLSTFPNRVYDDDAMTLEECGLVPNASLLLRKTSAKSQGHPM